LMLLMLAQAGSNYLRATAMWACLLVGSAAYTFPATVPAPQVVSPQFLQPGPVSQPVVIAAAPESPTFEVSPMLLLGAFAGGSLAALAIHGKNSGMDKAVNRRELLTKTLGTTAFLGAAAANAEVDYAGVGYLGGASTIDVNNANIRVYQKLPGMYPNAAGKVVSHAPYKNKEDMYARAGFSAKEAEATRKFDSRFIYLEPRPEYIIDNINNGLYR